MPAACVGAVRVAGAIYVRVGGAPLAGFEPGEHHATVTGRQPCRDLAIVGGGGEPAPGSDLADGESNFLDAGTRLYAVPGHPVGARLATETDAGWLFVAR